MALTKVDANQRYALLSEYFYNATDFLITLTFKQIADIADRKLPDSSSSRYFWYKNGFNEISACWIDNGYRIKRLHLNQRYVVFYRFDKASNSLQIPPILMSNKIPQKAKYELENYFQYIIKKYGL